jgi:CubicO group peptidase (beta-lactamase class C family)
LTDTYGATSGDKVPNLKELFTPGGKYYNSSIFPPGKKPGECFHYSNLGYVIAGTIIEIISQKRFDIYMQ